MSTSNGNDTDVKAMQAELRELRARVRTLEAEKRRPTLEGHGARVQAYRPLAHGEGSLLVDGTVRAIGRAHGKSAAQVALRWVLQLAGEAHAVVTSTESVPHMRADLEVFDWTLSDDEMETLAALDTAPETIGAAARPYDVEMKPMKGAL